ncbi:MAG: VOC family protein [Rhodopseudomonas sp.]|nr:VOC family protein [Rhodopseudomonas sp.]
MFVQSYLFLDGRAEEAITFYKQAVGATVDVLMRNKESPEPTMCAPGSDEKILHAAIKIGETTVMLSDGYAKGQPKFEGFGMALSVKTEAEADKIFAALCEGGKIIMPQTKTFFSPRFGMLHDKFGVQWMVLVSP